MISCLVLKIISQSIIACVEGSLVFIRGNDRQGVPMICHDGSYGTICDDGFDVNDAKVICRMLGYPTEGITSNCNKT